LSVRAAWKTGFARSTWSGRRNTLTPCGRFTATDYTS
jgi:hypothetical protein